MRAIKIILFSLFLTIILLTPLFAREAKEISFTLEDRERLIRLEVKVTELEKRMDQRFEQIDHRFEQIDKRFDEMITLMGIIVTAFAGIVAVTIAFAIWDRRTMIRPFEEKVRKIEADITENRERLLGLLEALKALSESDEKVREVLKRFNLL